VSISISGKLRGYTGLMASQVLEPSPNALAARISPGMGILRTVQGRYLHQPETDIQAPPHKRKRN